MQGPRQPSRPATRRPWTLPITRTAHSSVFRLTQHTRNSATNNRPVRHSHPVVRTMSIHRSPGDRNPSLYVRLLPVPAEYRGYTVDHGWEPGWRASIRAAGYRPTHDREASSGDDGTRTTCPTYGTGTGRQ